VHPIKELSYAAGRCAGKGCALIRQLANDQLAEWCCAAKETIRDEPAVLVSVSVAAWNRVSSLRCSISFGLPT